MYFLYMNGTKITYTKPKSQSSGKITIPNKIAEALNWVDKDKLLLSFEKINGLKGIFIAKRD